MTMVANLPLTMYAWRKHRGNPEPVSCFLLLRCSDFQASFHGVADRVIHVYQVWEQVAVPETPPIGFLCKVLASGGQRPLIIEIHLKRLKSESLTLVSSVCHSDHSLLTMDDTRPWVQEKYILVSRRRILFENRPIYNPNAVLNFSLFQGHEGSGEIVKIGDQVKDTRFKVVSQPLNIPPICVPPLPQG